MYPAPLQPSASSLPIFRHRRGEAKEAVHKLGVIIKSFIFAEPAACQEFRGEGSVDEFGRQDVKLETTGKLR